MPRFELAPDDGIVDERVVLKALNGERVPFNRRERVAIAQAMLARRRPVTEVAKAIRLTFETTRLYLVCVADERAQPLVGPDTHCCGCQMPAQWTVTYPDSATRDWCTAHAVRALEQLGAVRIPTPRTTATRRP